VIFLEWTSHPQILEYVVSYRHRDVPDAMWYDERTRGSNVMLRGLRAGTWAEYKIGTVCRAGSQPVYGKTYEIEMKPEFTPNPNCGIMPEIDLSNQEPLLELKPDDVFYAADFPILVHEVVSSKNGVFNGIVYGSTSHAFDYVMVKADMIDVKINTDYRMIDGEVVAVYDSVKKLFDADDIFEGGSKYGTVKDGISKTDFTVDYTISPDDSFIFSAIDSTIIVKGSDGIEKGSIPLSGKDFPVTVKDGSGNIYELAKDENGKIKAEKIGTDSQPLPENSVDWDMLDVETGVVKFEKSGIYAFDEWIPAYEKALLIRDKYQKIKDSRKKEYYVPYKLVPEGKRDIVKARLELAANVQIKPKYVIFRNKHGAEYESVYDSLENIYTINLVGGMSGDGQEIYALYPGGKGYLNLGKLIVVSYPEHIHKLTVVSVNGAKIDISGFKKKLEEIYSPLGINWKITEDSYEAPENSLKNLKKGSSGIFNDYPAAMKTFQQEYFSKKDVDNKTAYLYVISGATDDKSRDFSGFMPRARQFGYLFKDNFNGDDIYLAAAHELGHGIFSLKHTFDDSYKIPQSTTDNLMDYSNGSRLAKWQWDLVNDPGVIIRVFEKDEDAMKNQIFIDDREYIVRDGKVVDLEKSGFYNLWKSMNDKFKIFFSSKLVNQLLEDLSKSPVINNLICEYGIAMEGAGSTDIGFLIRKNSPNQVGLDFIGIKEMKGKSDEEYKQSILCFQVGFLPYQANDHTIAHEFFIHVIHFLTEINKLDANKLSKNEFLDKLQEIKNDTNYDNTGRGDGGDKDHYKFIIGEKKEMTEYVLEILKKKKTVEEQLNYLSIHLDEIKKYITHPNILKLNGGKKAVISKIKLYLQTGFKDYHDYIFKPLNFNIINYDKLDNDLHNVQNKTKSLWNIYIEE
jgi:hypothetical protein